MEEKILLDLLYQSMQDSSREARLSLVRPSSRTTREETLQQVAMLKAAKEAAQPIIGKQCFNDKKFLVAFGAGGSKPCATYIKLDASDRYIVDQTLYWYATNSEDEALYLVGLLNSDSLTKIISPYQPEGLQGKRHVHTLAPSSIQPYDADNIDHKQLAGITQHLIDELHATHIDTNPNSRTLQHRRSKIMAQIVELPSYQQYSELCEKILMGK